MPAAAVAGTAGGEPVTEREAAGRAAGVRYEVPDVPAEQAEQSEAAGPAPSPLAVTASDTATAPTPTTDPATTITPGTSSVGQEPGTARSVRSEADHEIDDHFRHIVCVLCNPAFEGTRQAPHDATCICGKRVREGDAPGPASAPQCILCNELIDHHFTVAHADD